MTDDPQLSLKEYLATVQEVVKHTFDTPVWVKAEIRNLSIKAGHYYLELAEKKRIVIRSLPVAVQPSGSLVPRKWSRSLNVKAGLN